jgi:hypothetical protein
VEATFYFDNGIVNNVLFEEKENLIDSSRGVVKLYNNIL